MPASSFIDHNNALVVEPNPLLVRPYEFLAPNYSEHRVISLTEADAFLAAIVPDLILLSASFSPLESVEFLRNVQSHSSKKIIPLIIVIDLHNRVNFVPGIFWDDMLAVLDSSVTEDVFVLTMSRITHWKPF